MSKHLILIGYRGVGKSTVAKALKEKTGLPLISTDQEIENRLGISILDYIENKHSWEAFRGIETEVLISCLSRKDSVIDCGGGIVDTPVNIEKLKKAGIVFYLKASISTLIERSKISGERPRLTKDLPLKEEIAKTLKRRVPLYELACHEEIDTEGEKLLESTGEIIRRYSSI